MALLKIGGVDMPTPSEFSVSIEDGVKAERNARFTMIIERIATKIKLEMSWNVLTATETATILNATADVFLSVTYMDPKANSLLTKTFYRGPAAVPMLFFNDGVPKYKGVKFNMIER